MTAHRSADYRPYAEPEARSRFSIPLLTETLSGFADPLQFRCHSAVGCQKFRCHATPQMMPKYVICKQLLLKTEPIRGAVPRSSLTAGKVRQRRTAVSDRRRTR